MASVLQIASPDAIRRIQRVQIVTIVWMSVEAAVSLFAAWRARSPALLAFGGDSAIELFSAVVVLWRFRTTAEHGDAERQAARVAGALLFGLQHRCNRLVILSDCAVDGVMPTCVGINREEFFAQELAALEKLTWHADGKQLPPHHRLKSSFPRKGTQSISQNAVFSRRKSLGKRRRAFEESSAPLSVSAIHVSQSGALK
jgi:hypothetical protein